MPNIDREEASHRLAKVIARAWTDEEFHRKLLADPRPALAEMGLEIPRDDKTRIIFHQNTDEERHYVIPAKPDTRTLSHEEIIRVALLGPQLVLPTILRAGQGQ